MSLLTWLGFCEHKWNTVKEIKIHGKNDEEYPIGRTYILECEKCGNIKIKQILH